MQNSISTDRLFLNNLTIEDSEFIIELVNSKGWLEFIGDRNVHSNEEAVKYIRKILHSENIYYWVVRIKDGNIPAGIVTFIKRDWFENFDIGFAFLPAFTGQGYAYESSKEVLKMVSSNPEYHTVLATTKPENVQSIKLLKKLGLYFEKEIEVGEKKLHMFKYKHII